MNIYDIAEKSGVSIATVSRVVNGSDKVSEKTKQKVLAVMNEESYVPNVFAKGMAQNSMKTIGILCPDIADDYMAKSVSYLEESLRENGYDCILGCSGHEQKSKEEHVSLLLSKRIDALILVGSTYSGRHAGEKEVRYIKEAAKRTPVFLINGWIDGENIYCTNADDYQAMYDVTTALIRRQKKRILFLYNSQSFSANQKMKGYEQALIDADYPVLGDLKFFTKNKIHQARDLLLTYKNLEFDAVVATEDGLAIAAMKYAKAKDIKIPDELSIVGYNNSPLSIACEPELTSVNSSIEEQCSITVRNMLDVLNQKTENTAKRTVIPCEIVKRSTTDF